MTKKHLTIVGAGPKAIAIAAKACVLAKLGFPIPEIVILEDQQLLAHWLPETGFTNGKLKLGTPAEKDIGFPYESLIWGEKFNAEVDRLMQQYSWQNFLISSKSFSVWIDRCRPAPNHQQWVNYLLWAFDQIQRECSLITLKNESFHEMEIADLNTWLVKTKDLKGNVNSFMTHGVVITGPGEIRLPENYPDHPHVMDAKSVWSKIHELETTKDKSTIAIIGNGETASTIAVVVGKLETVQKVDLIAALATNYSRGESYTENHMYTDPYHGHWHTLTLQDRKEFINRTDRGCFSIAMMRELDQLENINTIQGWFNSIEIAANNKVAITIDHGNMHEVLLYDYVIFAIGYDPIKFLTHRTSKKTRQEILNKMKTDDWNFASFEKNIIEDLSLGGLLPKLHLPMFAALQQGPGFPNLSCLGRLSDQILSAYIGD